MESKEDASHRDSGIMMQSGPDSPMPPLKDRSRAAYQQQQELEAQLEACLAELRNLCLREAEFTGRLPQEYPLRQGDKVPPVRRRIGTAFRLDEKTIISQGLDPLSILERDLALQLQIAAATRHLYREENLSKHIKKHRKNLVLKEERKLKELESAVNECRTVAAQEPRPSNTAPSEETQAPSHPAAQQLMVPDTPHSSLALPTCSAPPLQHTGLPLTQCAVCPAPQGSLLTIICTDSSLAERWEPQRHHNVWAQDHCGDGLQARVVKVQSWRNGDRWTPISCTAFTPRLVLFQKKPRLPVILLPSSSWCRTRHTAPWPCPPALPLPCSTQGCHSHSAKAPSRSTRPCRPAPGWKPALSGLRRPRSTRQSGATCRAQPCQHVPRGQLRHLPTVSSPSRP
uniref:Innate immunity activator n=1 Tax=Pelodiscus sinensis TaxID=13735 RepID=K7FHM9_PELSI